MSLTPSPTLDSLARLVQRMRSLQREFFRSQNRSLIEPCKAAERDVDRACLAALESPGLFDRGGDRDA